MYICLRQEGDGYPPANTACRRYFEQKDYGRMRHITEERGRQFAYENYRAHAFVYSLLWKLITTNVDTTGFYNVATGKHGLKKYLLYVHGAKAVWNGTEEETKQSQMNRDLFLDSVVEMAENEFEILSRPGAFREQMGWDDNSIGNIVGDNLYEHFRHRFKENFMEKLKKAGKIFIAFDEVSWLVNGDADNVNPRCGRLQALQRAFVRLIKCDIWPLYLDTASSIVELSPPAALGKVLRLS